MVQPKEQLYEIVVGHVATGVRWQSTPANWISVCVVLKDIDQGRDVTIVSEYDDGKETWLLFPAGFVQQCVFGYRKLP